MTIDERLEALAQSVELLLASQRDSEEKIRRLAIIAEQNEVRSQRTEEHVRRMTDAITRLARIADNHETRIERLEKQ